MKSSKPTLLDRQIAATNLAFKKASRAQKRVMIAKDALARLKSGKYRAENGIWARIGGVSDLSSDASLQRHIVKPGVQCECCALGAMMLSTVAINNQCSVGAYHDDELDGNNVLAGGEDDASHVSRFFSQSQLCLIEFVFEDGNGAVAIYDISDASLIAARAFTRLYNASGNNAHGLLIAILENIVRHDGTFKPAKEPGVKELVEEMFG